MKMQHDLPIETLEEWLVIATHGLVPAARERIKLEIEAHFSDVVTARIAAGMTQKDAESAALLALGGASDAGKSFRKKHLSEAEMAKLQTWLYSERTKDRATFLLGDFGTPFFSSLFCWIQFGGPDEFWFRPPWMAVLAVCAGSIFVALRIKSRFLVKNTPIGERLVRSLFLLETISLSVFSFYYFLAMPITLIRLAMIPLMIACTFVLYKIRWPVWQKLGDLKPMQNP
jgi:hypothetical protein